MTDHAQLVTIQHLLVRGTALCVFRGDGEDGRRRRYVASNLPRVPATGETWRIEGQHDAHPVHGPQIRVSTMRLERPKGRLLRDLLAGERFPGIGEATANRLWNELGDRLLDVLNDGDVVALAAALGDTDRARVQIETILAEWPNVVGEPELLAWCDRHGVPGRVAAKAAACYGPKVQDLLREDPYRLLAFASWKLVDGVARSLGVAPDDPRRQIAAVEASLLTRLDDGDTLMSADALRVATGKLLGSDATDGTLDRAFQMKAATRRPQGWQAPGPALIEEAIADRIVMSLALREPRSARTWVDGGEDITLNAAQSAAVSMALTERFSLIAGGAGTGKTAVLRAIVNAALADGRRVEMMALAGRAALRMREATGHDARTITGFLVQAHLGKIEITPNMLVIVDEASMADVGSLYSIIRRIPPTASILLVGDDGQLPPVGFGLTLHALLDVPEIPRVVLTEVMRQAAETGIPSFAASLRKGRLDDAADYVEDSPTGVSMVVCAGEDVAAQAVAIRRRLPSAQIVGSVKRAGDPADGGTHAMNVMLHDAWARSRKLPQNEFVPGEPVIWTVNDYDLDLWNGSLGRVIGMVGDGLAVKFDEGERIIPIELTDNLELAWAVTTHKAQGSQFDTVIVPVTKSRILDRTLLYTAVTRARKRVILVGDPDVVREALGRPPQALARRTWLREAIRQKLDAAQTLAA